MATDDNRTEEPTIEDILNLGRSKATAKAGELLGEGRGLLQEGRKRAGELSDTVQPYLTEGRRRAGELSDRTQKTYTSMMECAKGESHLWYQMWAYGAKTFTDSAKGLMGSKPSELKSKSGLSYVGGLLGGTLVSILSLPALIVEEGVRYAARKLSEKK